MIPKSISIDIDINLIQSIRMIHALSESEFTISLPLREQKKLLPLSERFNIPFTDTDENGLKFSQIVKTDHFSNDPNSVIGSIHRPLIFPQQLVKFCKSLWHEKRVNRYTFTGLLTGSRKNLLEQWMVRNIKQGKIGLHTDESLISKVKKRIFRAFNLDNTTTLKIGDLTIWSSTRGRQFPLKSWDENYYLIMSNSEFVLCPSGDFVWTYRFFEAILCGAIPIVEEVCNSYSGFRFKFMSDDAKEYTWSEEDAEYNYNLCVRRITIPLEELNSELNRLYTGMTIQTH